MAQRAYDQTPPIAHMVVRYSRSILDPFWLFWPPTPPKQPRLSPIGHRVVALGAICGISDPSWSKFKRPKCVRPRPSKCPFGRTLFWHHSGTILRPFWPPAPELEPFWYHFGSIFGLENCSKSVVFNTTVFGSVLAPFCPIGSGPNQHPLASPPHSLAPHHVS